MQATAIWRVCQGPKQTQTNSDVRVRTPAKFGCSCSLRVWNIFEIKHVCVWNVRQSVKQQTMFVFGTFWGTNILIVGTKMVKKWSKTLVFTNFFSTQQTLFGVQTLFVFGMFAARKFLSVWMCLSKLAHLFGSVWRGQNLFGSVPGRRQQRRPRLQMVSFFFFFGSL